MKSWRSWLALSPALLIIGVVFGTSVVYGVGQSLGWLPFLGRRELSLDAYARILSGPYRQSFWSALGFSLWVSLAATLLSALAALALALALGVRLRATRGVLTLLNLNLSFPHLVWAVTMLLMLGQSGLLARVAAALGWIDGPGDFPVLVRDRAGWGIILAYVAKEVPFLMLILLSILRTQSENYAQVAATLGASRWQRLRWVTLPLVGPGLLSGSLLVFAFIFGAYEVPALLGVTYPEMLAVLSLKFFGNPDLNARAEGMAISVLMALVVVAVVLLAGRWRRQEQA